MRHDNRVLTNHQDFWRITLEVISAITRPCDAVERPCMPPSKAPTDLESVNTGKRRIAIQPCAFCLKTDGRTVLPVRFAVRAVGHLWAICGPTYLSHR